MSIISMVTVVLNAFGKSKEPNLKFWYNRLEADWNGARFKSNLCVWYTNLSWSGD